MLKPHPDDRRKVVTRPESHKSGGGRRATEPGIAETQEPEPKPPPVQEMSIENPDAIRKKPGNS